MKKTFLPLVFIATCLLAACHGNDAESIRLAEARHAAQVEALMQQLSIREKVAQLFVMEISREPSEETMARQDSLVREYGVGGAIIMRGPIEPFVQRMNELQSMASLPLLVATDAEWGAAMRFAEYLPYPRQRILGRLEGRQAERLIYKMGRNVGRELRDLGIYVNYAPVADVCPDPYDQSDGQRSFSGDPEEVGGDAGIELVADGVDGKADEQHQHLLVGIYRSDHFLHAGLFAAGGFPVCGGIVGSRHFAEAQVHHREHA
ncbi:MAG: hypothetical protein II435_04440 [Bacteroidales bacterium]|nr:hypothetical protein [Bacteroidales bacterium]